MKIEAYGFVAVEGEFDRKGGSVGRYIKLPIHAKLRDGGFADEAEQWLTIFLPDESREGIDSSVKKGDRIRVAGYFTPDAENPAGGVVRPMELEILEKGKGSAGSTRSTGTGTRSSAGAGNRRSSGTGSTRSSETGSTRSSAGAGNRRSSGRF